MSLTLKPTPDSVILWISLKYIFLHVSSLNSSLSHLWLSVVENSDRKAILLKFESWLCHLTHLEPWENNLSSLCLSFLIFKWGVGEGIAYLIVKISLAIIGKVLKRETGNFKYLINFSLPYCKNLPRLPVFLSLPPPFFWYSQNNFFSLIIIF